MYVALEGIDTAGKSTQISALKEAYKDAIFTKEPAGTKFGTRIRDILLDEGLKLDERSEFFLFLSDRAQHTKEILIPNKDKLIISDRSMISGVSYDRIFEMGQSIELNLLATSNTIPDLAILLELTRGELESRLAKKPLDVIEKRGAQYLIDIQEKMKAVIKNLGCEALIIDASANKDQISKTIIEKINSML